jgi:hypothetical protein
MRGFLFSIVILGIFSCSKEVKVSKELEGNWELTSYKRTDNEGLVSYPNASGTAEFKAYDNSKDSSTYIWTLISDLTGSIDTFTQKGTYKLSEKAGFMYVSEFDSLNQINSYIKYRILTLTKTDLEIEFSKNSNTDILLFRRN